MNDYEEMLKSFQKLSLNPTIKEELSYIRQRMSCISVWEARVCIHADLVKTREEAIKTRQKAINDQEVVIQTLETEVKTYCVKYVYRR